VPIKKVERIVPTPPAVRLIPLTDATVLLGYRSAGNASNIVAHAAKAKLDIEKNTTIRANCEV
jgi:hypothetical protein